MKQVRQEARNRLMDRIAISAKESRFYMAEKEGYTELYYYSRDKEQMDIWFLFYTEER